MTLLTMEILHHAILAVSGQDPSTVGLDSPDGLASFVSSPLLHVLLFGTVVLVVGQIIRSRRIKLVDKPR